MSESNVVVSPNDLATLTTEALRTELARSLQATADHLVRLAAIVRELESRGEDLTDLKMGRLLHHLRLIATGQVLPALVARFASQPMLLDRLSRLPTPDQERFASGASVQLAVRAPDGSITHRLVDPSALGRDQVSQAFGADHVRSLPEQIALLEDRRERNARNAPPPPRGQIRADRETGCLRVGRSVLPLGDVLAALADLHGGDDEIPEDAAVQAVLCQLTDEEHRRLKVRAAVAGVPMVRLVRRALVASGLLS